jgi:4,5-dihydroxyphthalate decarboxylase
MLISGALDATLRYIRSGNLVDRSTADLSRHPLIRPLFDPFAEGKRYFEATGIFPINHGMVIKRETAEKHPWLLQNIYRAFEAAREIAEQRRLDHAAEHLAAGRLPAGAGDALATPLVRYGITANRTVLETIARYSHEQGLTPRVVGLDELFADSLLDT